MFPKHRTPTRIRTETVCTLNALPPTSWATGAKFQHYLFLKLFVPLVGIEPTLLAEPDFESSVSAYSTTRASVLSTIYLFLYF